MTVVGVVTCVKTEQARGYLYKYPVARQSIGPEMVLVALNVPETPPSRMFRILSFLG